MQDLKREAERCPICGTKSNWVTDVHCYCCECCFEFNPKTQVIYKIDMNGKLKPINNKPIVIEDKNKVKVKAKKCYARGLRYWRLEKGFSLAKLGDSIGCADMSISFWERCKQPISEHQLKSISEALNVPVEELLKQYDEKEPCILRRLRLAANLKQSELGEKLGKPNNVYVSLYERDSSRFLKLSLDEQHKIASLLNVDLEELISEIRKEIEK